MKTIIVIELNKLRWVMPNTVFLTNTFPVEGNENLLKTLKKHNIKFTIK